MKIKVKLVHHYNDYKIIYLPIVQKYGYVGKKLYISEDIENAYEFKSLEEYIKKAKKKYKSKFICVTKFSAFEIMKTGETYVYFIELTNI